ncbi:MAG: formylglycine-generating enzyme family protein [Kiritimatiellae bacterium]|nr:formylglycine-generating enzyme family protein [Kiritimatiellia bacterium]
MGKRNVLSGWRGWAVAVAVMALPVFSGPEAPAPSGERPAGARMTVTLPGGMEMAFRWCPPGTFEMGSPDSEYGRMEDETRHRVTLTKGFWIGETEVTQAQWEGVMAGWLSKNNPSTFKGPDLPVDSVSWKDCRRFIRKVNARAAFTLRLPTEAEWEYACRAGSGDAFGGRLPTVGWFLGNSGGTTHPVGQKRPNGWGCYDMHGNVAEWCGDLYDARYPDQAVTDPFHEPPFLMLGRNQVLRGGCWRYEAQFCRSAIRHGRGRGSRDPCFGFRVVCEGE